MYGMVPDVAIQVSTLLKSIPELRSYDLSVMGQSLPSTATAWLAIPRLDRLGATHAQAMKRMIVLVEKNRPNFRSFCDIETGYQQVNKCASFWKKLAARQECDILIIPGQIDEMRQLIQGQSITDVLSDFGESEWPFGGFELLTLLLTVQKFPLINRMPVIGLGDRIGGLPKDRRLSVPSVRQNSGGTILDGSVYASYNQELAAFASFSLYKGL